MPLSLCESKGINCGGGWICMVLGESRLYCDLKSKHETE